MTSSVPRVAKRANDGLDRALHVALDDQRELLAPRRRLELGHHLLERTTHGAGPHRRAFATLALAIIGDLAGARLAVDNGEPVAGLGRAVEAQHLHRHRRAGGVHVWLPLIADQRPHPAPFGAGDHDVARLKSAALHEHGGDRPAAAVELGLDHRAFGGAGRGRP